MEVTASSPLFEIAFVLVRLDHVASIVINADYGMTRSCDFSPRVAQARARGRQGVVANTLNLYRNGLLAFNGGSIPLTRFPIAKSPQKSENWQQIWQIHGDVCKSSQCPAKYRRRHNAPGDWKVIGSRGGTILFIVVGEKH